MGQESAFMDSKIHKRKWSGDHMPPGKHNWHSHWTLTNMVSMPLRSSSRLSDLILTISCPLINGPADPPSQEPACLASFSRLPVSRSQVSSHQQEVLMENITRMSERSQLLQQSLGEATTDADLLENIWKLENLFQNHSDWMQRLEILVKVWRCLPSRACSLRDIKIIKVSIHKLELVKVQRVYKYWWCTWSDFKFSFAAEPRGGVQDHPGSLSPVRELPGAARRQVVHSEQLHRLEHIRLDFRGHPSLHVAPEPRLSHKVLEGFFTRAL